MTFILYIELSGSIAFRLMNSAHCIFTVSYCYAYTLVEYLQKMSLFAICLGNCATHQAKRHKVGKSFAFSYLKNSYSLRYVKIYDSFSSSFGPYLCLTLTTTRGHFLRIFWGKILIAPGAIFQAHNRPVTPVDHPHFRSPRSSA